MSTTSGASASATSLAHYLTGRHKPKANDRFLRHSKTWREVAKIVEDHPKGSVAFWIAALGHDPRNYDYAHVYDDSKSEDSEEYQTLVDMSYRIRPSSRSNGLASGSRKRKVAPLSANSQSQPSVEVTTETLMADSEDEDEWPPSKRQRGDQPRPLFTLKERNEVRGKWTDAIAAIAHARGTVAAAESGYRKRKKDFESGKIDWESFAEGRKALDRAKRALARAREKEKALERLFQSMQEDDDDDDCECVEC
jgi:hypothetical protein